jgi:hypothetical protein
MFMIKRSAPQPPKLPFVKRKGKRAVWWNVIPTGMWVEDFTIGRRYAQEFLQTRGTEPTFSLDFQQIILAMIEASKDYDGRGFSGIESGFLLAVGEYFAGMSHVHAHAQNVKKLEEQWDKPLIKDVTMASSPSRRRLISTPNNWELRTIRKST